MKVEQIKRILNEAEALKEGSIDNRDYGICHNLAYWEKDYICHINIVKFLQVKLLKWDKYSGSFGFPIPHPILNPKYAYDIGLDKWDRNTEYGQNRWEALDYIIEELKELVG